MTACMPAFLTSDDERLAAVDPDRSRGSLGIVINRSDAVLLNLRDDKPSIVHPNQWSVLGGLCDPGEDEAAAIVRELAEEVSLRVTELFPFRRLVDIEGRGHLLTAFIVRTRAELSDLVLCEGQALGYFSWAEAARLKLVPFARRLLAAYFEA